MAQTAKKTRQETASMSHQKQCIWLGGAEGIRLGFGVKKKTWKNSTKIMDTWIYEDLHLDSFGFDSHSTFKHHDCGSLRCVNW